MTAGLTHAGGERGVGHEAGITRTSVAAHGVHTLAVGTHTVQLALIDICNNTTKDETHNTSRDLSTDSSEICKNFSNERNVL